MRKTLVVLAGTLLTLSACSSQPDAPPAPTPPQAPSTYESTAKFTEAMNQAGYPCQGITTTGLTVSCADTLFFTVGDPKTEVCTPLESNMNVYAMALDERVNKFNFDTVEERKAEYTRFVSQPMIVGQNWALWPKFDWWTTGQRLLWPADFDVPAMATSLGGTQQNLGTLCQFPATLEEAQR